ncbi:MAG: HNH endonuclease signature motif containing protein [Actinomycetes bacterium]
MFESGPESPPQSAGSSVWDLPPASDEPASGESSADDEWSWPGRPTTAASAQPDPAAAALVAAVDALLEQDPAVLDGAVALQRCRTLLSQGERLGLATGFALLDVQARALHEHEGARAVSTWLQRQPGGDGGRLSRAARLAARPAVRRAVATGAMGLSSADVVCRALDAAPSSAEPGQVEGVLTNAVPDLLERWVAGSATAGVDGAGDELTQERAAVVQEAIEAGLEATASAPADRLEPAFALLGQALSPGVLADQLQLLIDALAPERLEDAEQQAYEERGLKVWKKRGGPGYRGSMDLTDEVGHALTAQLAARAQQRREEEARLRKAAEQGRAGAEFGTAGPGSPGASSASTSDSTSAAARPISDEQLAHDLFAEMLDDLAGVRAPGAPRPATLSITAGLDAVEGRLGALPGSVLLAGRPSPISPEAVRRHGCDGFLSAVLLDALRQPVGASGTHRHATERERRILKAIWGDYCAEDGCGATRTVPHHVRPWWMTGRTDVADLVPVCEATHHAVHDGHQTITLRDGRQIDEFGWVDRPRPGTVPPPQPADPWRAEPPEPYPDAPSRLWTPPPADPRLSAWVPDP